MTFIIPVFLVYSLLMSSDIVEASFLYSCKEINQLSKSMLYSFDDSDSELSELTNEGKDAKMHKTKCFQFPLVKLTKKS